MKPRLSRERLEELLGGFGKARIAVIGDFFLDRYLVTDPALSETSIETGLEALQVVSVRSFPGAAGTVTNNLASLGAGRIYAVGSTGDDGEAFELIRGLKSTGVETDYMFRFPGCVTPAYIKPMVREPGGERELSRLDIKNRAPLPEPLGLTALRSLDSLLSSKRIDAVIVSDQVGERNCGQITDSVRAGLILAAGRYPGVPVFVDSRARIGEFMHVYLKPNAHEAASALNLPPPQGINEMIALGQLLEEMTGSPIVFLTLSEAGMAVCTSGGAEHVPAPPVAGPLDIVGAGDSAMAGIVCATCAGAGPQEAATIGNMCAAVTIRKLGTTGTASQDELRAELAAS